MRFKCDSSVKVISIWRADIPCARFSVDCSTFSKSLQKRLQWAVCVMIGICTAIITSAHIRDTLCVIMLTDAIVSCRRASRH